MAEEVRQIQEDFEHLRRRIKDFERCFLDQHGHKPTRHDIKAIPPRAKDYHNYQKMRDAGFGEPRTDSRRLEKDVSEDQSKGIQKVQRQLETVAASLQSQQQRGRTEERSWSQGKENERPTSHSRSQSRLSKRDTKGRFRPNTNPPEDGRPGQRRPPSSPSRRHILRDSKNGRFTSSTNSSQNSSPRSQQRKRPRQSESSSKHTGDDNKDIECTPKRRKTFVNATPKKNGECVSILDCDYPGLGDLEENETDRMCGAMHLRNSARLVATQAATEAQFQVNTTPHKSLGTSQNKSWNFTDYSSISTPSKGKQRATSCLPEVTPSNPHRFGRTPPSSGRHFAINHTFMGASHKRKHNVIDLTDDDPSSSPASKTGAKSLLTPRSKPTSSSPNVNVLTSDIPDDFATPEFLMKRSTLRAPPDSHDIAGDNSGVDRPDLDAIGTATPSKGRAQSLSVFSRPLSSFRDGKLKSICKPLSQFMAEAHSRQEASMDEMEEAADSYKRECVAAAMQDGMDGDERDEVQGSSNNPFNRKKAPKRQTKKLNLKPKPALMPEKAMLPPSAPAHPRGSATDTATSNTMSFTFAKDQEAHDDDESEDKVRGEPARKRHRSSAPTVDSVAFALSSVEGHIEGRAEAARLALEGAMRASSHEDTPDAPNVQTSTLVANDVDTKGEDDFDELPMINKSSVITSASTSQNVQNGKIAKKSGHGQQVAGKHALATNFKAMKNLSRGKNKKKMRERGWRAK
ncbi:MAG: hypothetical protein Q9159_001747 [Coniocarpon cinnabarinum]